MKIAIDFGHNCYPDTGASGVMQEDVGTREIGSRVVNLLNARGHQAFSVTPAGQRFNSVIGSLGYRCQKSNAAGADVYASIHMNAGGGRGTEVYAMSVAGRQLAQRVLDSILQLGFVNRGVKDGASLYVLRNTSAVAILIETCFCDSAEDVNRLNYDCMAEAIVNGLLGQVASIPSPAPVQRPAVVNYDPQVAALQRALNKLKIRDDRGCALGEDGIPGECTLQAVKKFQRMMGLDADGIPGPCTWGAINQILAKPFDAVEAPHLEYATRYIQWRVGSTIDGSFGNATALDVLHWQAVHVPNSRPDGIVGSQTWAALLD